MAVKCNIVTGWNKDKVRRSLKLTLITCFNFTPHTTKHGLNFLSKTKVTVFIMQTKLEFSKLKNKSQKQQAKPPKWCYNKQSEESPRWSVPAPCGVCENVYACACFRENMYVCSKVSMCVCLYMCQNLYVYLRMSVCAHECKKVCCLCALCLPLCTVYVIVKCIGVRVCVRSCYIQELSQLIHSNIKIKGQFPTPK